MYNNPYFIPSFNQAIIPPAMMNPNLIRSAGILSPTRNLAASTLTNTTKSTGLLSRLGTGLSGIKKINWGGLINNTSKTLGIINQTIPLVKQVGPVVNNMRSMVRIASIFKDETDIPQKRYTPPPNNNNNNINHTPNTNITNTTSYQTTNYQEKETWDESPTFFINT